MQITWNGFDTFLRRAAMIGAVLLIWGAIALGVVAGSAIVSIVHNQSTPSVTSVDYPIE